MSCAGRFPHWAICMAGPFVFFDQMGPVALRPRHGLDVRSHPHIGLATVTYLFEDALLHRDSLGNVQRIEPGGVIWMTAERGIVHSERSPVAERSQGHMLSGIQIWMALPKGTRGDGACLRACSFSGASRDAECRAHPPFNCRDVGRLRSPVPTLSGLFYADVRIEEVAVFCLPEEHAQRGCLCG